MNKDNSEISTEQTVVGIIGGGIAGSTIAVALSEIGVQVKLFESGPSLVNGPPICHLHAGGNLYRELGQQQCLTLLRQSIETIRLYPHAIDYRPTVIAIPKSDNSSPEKLIPQLQFLQSEYQKLVESDSANQVLGSPEQYYQLYDREKLTALAQHKIVPRPNTPDQWMAAVVNYIDLDLLQFPLILVQEYGMSVFRLAASVTLALEKNSFSDVFTQAKVKAVNYQKSQQKWQIAYQENNQLQSTEVDYLVNACGFRTGIIDDMIREKRPRMVEFKAAYVTHWQNTPGVWPEVVFLGERGTPNGMAQLTPYPDGYFQLHGMTQDITLFKDGLVTTNTNSAQPNLPDNLLTKIDQHWPAEIINERTEKSIAHMAKYMPAFANAKLAGKPLFGAQQIPGDDPTLRVADVSFSAERYARCEIVKASSALAAADMVINQLTVEQLIPNITQPARYFSCLESISDSAVDEKALALTQARGYPAALAKRNNSKS